ncbi:MAG: ABC-F family ATP-binding cassette domain-containing protein [Lachnospiraceae bacterium]|nr:ABC-F family ATP-binding cassette domain-containing protein [Lachnospiraceae bacterium]
MILSAANISKSYNEIPILKDVSFHIEEHDRVAIVGPNGCGKTTLIRIITGNLTADNGTVAIARDTTLGYLEQDVSVSFKGTVLDVLINTRDDILSLEKTMQDMNDLTASLSGDALDRHVEELAKIRDRYETLDGYSYRSRVMGIFKGLGFTDADSAKNADTLSGGEKMRLKLGATLLTSPDILILDEPTNHLDMNSLEWLESYLKNYQGTVIVVSHDRFFLDRVVNKIIEIDQGDVTLFSGNYSDYAVKKEVLRTARMNAYLKQQDNIRHQEEVIKKLQSYNREKSIKRAESRKKMLSKIRVIEKPRDYNDEMRIVLEPCIESGKDVLSIRNISKSFDGRVLFEDQSIEIKRGEHIAIIGDNGTGKTTLLKMINGLELPDSGEIVIGTKVHIAYYDQEHHVLDDSKTLFQEISDTYPRMTETEIRTTLAAFLFTEDEVFKIIGTLSGGEKGRLSLAKLMLSDANLLILDEPTNHLDITSREILEDAINHYTGTVLYVSHDRYFIDRTAERIIELDNLSFTSYEGDYTYYLYKSAELKEQRFLVNDISTRQISGNDIKSTLSGLSFAASTFGTSSSSDNITPVTLSLTQGAADYQAQKKAAAQKRKLENDIKKCEDEIEQLEKENSDLEAKMNLPEIATNSVKLQEVSNKLASNNDRITQLMELWENLSDQ